MTRFTTRNVRIAAAAGALMVAGLGFGVPGIAHPHDGADDKSKVEKVIVINTRRDGADGKHARGDRVRRLRTLHLDGAHAVACDGERIALGGAADGDGDRTRVIFCSKEDLTAAQRIEKLEKAIDRIRSNDELSAEHKERVTAALREAIEGMRTAP